MAVFSDDVIFQGAVYMLGTKPEIARSELLQSNNDRFKIQPTDWRVWNAFAVPLPGDGQTEEGTVPTSYSWDPNSADDTFFVAVNKVRVIGITSRVEVAGTDAGAVTAAIKKAASGTDIASGTALHSSTINLKGTVDTNQALTLSVTSSDLDIAAGTSIGIDFTGVLTAARGCVTVLLSPAASADDLVIVGGTFGTNSPTIQTGDLKAAGSTSKYARCMFQLPSCYVAGQSVTIRAHAGMKTTVADTAATVDFEVYRSNDEEGIGSDLCTTAATSINSLTDADKDFAVTSATLNPGDTLDIRMTVLVNDAATGTAVIGQIGSVELLLDVKG